VARVVSDRDLESWKQSMTLEVDCYQATRTFPTEEQFGLSSQIRRAAASVPANIAEGNGRETTGAYIQSLRVAQGSLKELETHILLSSSVGLLASDASSRLLDASERVGRLLRSLIRALQAKGQT